MVGCGVGCWVVVGCGVGCGEGRGDGCGVGCIVGSGVGDGVGRAAEVGGGEMSRPTMPPMPMPAETAEVTLKPISICASENVLTGITNVDSVASDIALAPDRVRSVPPLTSRPQTPGPGA